MRQAMAGMKLEKDRGVMIQETTQKPEESLKEIEHHMTMKESCPESCVVLRSRRLKSVACIGAHTYPIGAGAGPAS